MTDNLPPGVTQRMIDEAMGLGPCCSACGREVGPEEDLEEVWIHDTRRAMCSRCASEYEDAGGKRGE